MPQHGTWTMDREGRYLLISVAVLVQAVAWNCARIGVAKYYDECSGFRHCDIDVIPSWWSLSFSVFVLVVFLVGLVASLDRCRVPLVALLATSTVTTMLEAQRWLVMKRSKEKYYDDGNHVPKLLTDGFILTSFMNIVLMALVGISGAEVNRSGDDTPPEQQQEQQEGYRPPSPLAV